MTQQVNLEKTTVSLNLGEPALVTSLIAEIICGNVL